MIETMGLAVVAICQALNNLGYMSLEGIDRIVFYNVADRKLLKKILTEMKSDGMLMVISNGCYKLTDRGHKYLDQNA